MYRIKFINSNEAPIFVQVDPWACLYKLEKGDEIEFAACSGGDEAVVEVDEFSDSRILTLVNSEEFFVTKNGETFHWTEFQTNIAE